MAENQPRASFTVTVTEADYLAAARIASARGGLLAGARRGAWAALAAGLLLVFLTRALWVKVAVAAVAVCAAGLIWWLSRRRVAAIARRDFAVFASLLSPATAQLWEDEMRLVGAALTRIDPYALLPLMVETPTLFVFLREDGSFALLPKHDIPADGGRIHEFLRTTFARKTRRIK